MSLTGIIFAALTYGICIYTIAILLFYIFIGLYSIGETRFYLNKNKYTDYRLLASSPHIPTISVIAPAYNEGATIIDNVRSLLSLYYHNLEVIIVNDGSKDDTLSKLVQAYDLEKTERYISKAIPTKAVLGVYQSRNPVYRKLLVVDKVNGGKADSLNVGINISENDHIVSIDVDCILEQDALLKIMKPFLEESEVPVIATGGVVRVANSCEIVDGRLRKVFLPKNYWACLQSLEYIRAFILSRMAWSRLNGLLIISGAFGAFDKRIVLACGGYDTKTVGEDMELIVRMRRYMEENRRPYKVAFIPDPLCWTETPDSRKIFIRQRNRWARGTIETLRSHRVMFFNPAFGVLGMLSYPFWFFFEMFAPVVEFVGFLAFLILAVLGIIAWTNFLALLVFIISFGYLYSVFAAFMEVASFNVYRRKTEIRRLLLTALSEPFYFHPIVVWSAILGHIDIIRNKKGWGEMSRRGFGANGTAKK